MVELPQIAWIALGCIAAASTLAILHALGAMIQTEQRVEELRAKVTRLKFQYRKRLAEAQNQEVLVVDEDPSAAAPIHAAA